MYSLNSSLYASVFVVPRDIVDKYIKMASFCAVKSLLWILNYRGGAFSVSELAKSIGSSEADVKEALDYWVNEGVLVKDGETVAAQPVTSDSHLLKDKAEKAEKPAEKKEVVINEELIQPTLEQVANRLNDKNFRDLCNFAQEKLGRDIGYDTQAKLLQIVDGYGLPIEIILRLIQYCVDIGKTSNAFILSVAKSWYKNDIMTYAQAEEYVNSHSEARMLYSRLRIMLSLTAESPSPTLESFLINWKKMGFHEEMICLAYYEATDRQKPKPFNYANGILERWYKDGIKTPEDVEKSKERAKAKREPSSQRSEDIKRVVEKSKSDDLIYEKKKKSKRGEN